MPYIKELNGNPDQQSFPGATFEIEGEVPQAQCSEAKIEGDDADTYGTYLEDIGAFTGYDLIGKKCTILEEGEGPPGTYNIIANTNNFIQVDQLLGGHTPVSYYIHNGGSLIITRNISSFATYLDSKGYAYTIKGGKLYTNASSVQLQPACSILFDPLT